MLFLIHVGINVSLPNFNGCNVEVWIDSQFHPTLYDECNSLSMWGSALIYIIYPSLYSLLRPLMTEFNRITDALLEKLATMADGTTMVTLLPMMNRTTLELIAKVYYVNMCVIHICYRWIYVCIHEYMYLFMCAPVPVVNSLWPRDVIWRRGSRSTLDHVMACCLTAPSYYLNQYWLIISEVHWQSPEGNSTRDTATINELKLAWKLLIKIFVQNSQGPMS